MEISHRHEKFLDLIEIMKQDLKDLLSIPKNYNIMFLQGGARTQFSSIPINLIKNVSETTDYIDSGYWSRYAACEAKKYCIVNLINVIYYEQLTKLILPMKLWKISKDSKYVHYCPNETIDGIAMHETPNFKNKIIIDKSNFYRNNIAHKYRSYMNVVFHLPNINLNDLFLKLAQSSGLLFLKGHRVSGGIRASLYNAMPISGVKKLIEFMKINNMNNNIILNPISYVYGSVHLPGSKSISNRAILLSAHTQNQTELINIPDNDDIAVMLRALKHCKIKNKRYYKNQTCKIQGNQNGLKSFSKIIFLKHSGTAMRLLTAALSIRKNNVILMGSDRMHQRPIGPLVDALRQGGAKIDYLDKKNFPPLKIFGGYSGDSGMTAAIVALFCKRYSILKNIQNWEIKECNRIEAIKKILNIQKKFYQPPGLIAEGRDMGSIVFPEASVKIFLDASLKIRATRRMKQLQKQGFNKK
uniref:Uncharacterized protein n=1 Tax=Glossina austeni TaxID=7395 RepID=A0A1A9UKG4_GLOAU